MGEVIDFNKYVFNRKLKKIRDRWTHLIDVIYHSPKYTLSERVDMMCEIGDNVDRLDKLRKKINE